MFSSFIVTAGRGIKADLLAGASLVLLKEKRKQQCFLIDKLYVDEQLFLF